MSEAAVWWQVDIADRRAVGSLMRRVSEALGRIDLVIHFAAFYHFGTDWRPEYQRVNVLGTRHVLESAAACGVRRVIFASSVAAVEPQAGGAITERTPAEGRIPYARSKALGERMVRAISGRLPGIVLRIAGVFSGWCELPPLASLMRLWGGRSAAARLVAARGETGMPYIHRQDLVRIVRACAERHARLPAYEVLLASPHGTVRHRELFAAIRRACRGEQAPRPIPVSPTTARLGLLLRWGLGLFTGCEPYEQPWMLRYIDRPWVTDTRHTRRMLQWDCTPGLGLLDCLPAMAERFRLDRHRWERLNRMREQRRYQFHPDDD